MFFLAATLIIGCLEDDTITTIDDMDDDDTCFIDSGEIHEEVADYF